MRPISPKVMSNVKNISGCRRWGRTIAGRGAFPNGGRFRIGRRLTYPQASVMRHTSRLSRRPIRTRPQFSQLAEWWALTLAFALSAAVSAAQDATPTNQLSFKVGLTGTAVSEEPYGRKTTLEFADRIAGEIEVQPQQDGAGGITWYPRGGEVKLAGRIAQSSRAFTVLRGEGGTRSDETILETYTGAIACDGNLVNAFVKLRPADKRYDIQFALMADMATTQEAVLYSRVLDVRGDPSVGGGRHEESSQKVPLSMGTEQTGLGSGYYFMTVEVKDVALGGGDVLTGSARIPVPKPAGWNGAWAVAIDASWRVGTALPPVELVVTIDGYANWRPLGSIKNPTEPGNHLVARATLKSKGAGAKLLPAVKAIRFALLDSSREPGVCLNWPLNAKDDDYDLRLAVATGGGVLSKQDQNLEVKEPRNDEDGQPYAETRIDSYDFGGRASLRAICLLEDGREIEGVMKGEGDFVRLPKMNGPDWIAEAWRKEKKVEKLAAMDDDEKVEGQKHNGDGYTLYEEYRGWAVNGQHVEGDPERKDFFVLNLFAAKADAQNGINLFEALSKLRVHSKLRRSEMSQTVRLMNGNHRDGTHRVDQHGVWVKVFTRAKLGDNGADTPMTKAGVAGRPSITKGVGILARGDTESIFNQPFNLPARDTILAYDRAIAHELLHSVGVEHHGPPDEMGYALKFIPPNVPANKIGRPHYQTGDGTAFTLLQENGHDLAASVYVNYAEVMAKFSPMMMDMLIALWSKGPAGSSDPAEAKRLAEASLSGAFDRVYEQRGLVGMERGAHSGDQDCVMRYYFARFYEAKRAKNTLYIVTPGSERISIDLCHAGTGTGINAPGHKPQTRYGNAAAGEGDCFSQICPNDAIPPRKVK